MTQACRAHGVAQIGNVLNWVERDPDVFVASAICESGEALFRAVEDHARGLLPLGGYRASAASDFGDFDDENADEAIDPLS